MTGVLVSNAFLNFLASLKTQAVAALTVQTEASQGLDGDVRAAMVANEFDLFDDGGYAGRMTSNGLGSLDIGGRLGWPSPDLADRGFGQDHGLT